MEVLPTPDSLYPRHHPTSLKQDSQPSAGKFSFLQDPHPTPTFLLSSLHALEPCAAEPVLGLFTSGKGQTPPSWAKIWPHSNQPSPVLQGGRKGQVQVFMLQTAVPGSVPGSQRWHGRRLWHLFPETYGGTATPSKYPQSLWALSSTSLDCMEPAHSGSENRASGDSDLLQYSRENQSQPGTCRGNTQLPRSQGGWSATQTLHHPYASPATPVSNPVFVSGDKLQPYLSQSLYLSIH